MSDIPRRRCPRVRALLRLWRLQVLRRWREVTGRDDPT
jgi:hypothetical protein